MEEKTGTIAEIVYRNEENGYTVAVMEAEDEFFTIVGSLPECRKGARYRLAGSFREHPSYGAQFEFREFEEIMPEDSEQIFDFLRSGVIRGVGPATAALIVGEFGDDALRVIGEEPERLTAIPGIGEKTAAKIAGSYAGHREFARVSMIFQSYGISAAQALRLYKAYGPQAADLIEEDPYRLVDEVPGFGFRKADRIAEKMGIGRDSLRRVKCGVRFALWRYADEGSTYVPRSELCDKVGELLDLPAERVYEGVVESAFEGSIRVETLDDADVVYLYTYYDAERCVAASLAGLQDSVLKTLNVDIGNLIRDTESRGGLSFSEQQKRAITSSVANGVSIITGGPGTGKTTIINSLIEILEKGGCRVAICAPTGRAAKRITETSGHPAQTIHRLLEYYYNDETEEMRFGKNADEPLEYDAVIVDECSMVDIMLMRGLTDALRRGTRLIMIGDADQLPSVGAGNVLRDMIASGFCHTVKLKEIFRQAEESMIVVNAHRINAGEYPCLNSSGSDFYFMERRNEQDIASLMIDLVSRRLPAFYPDMEPLTDIQVLTPVRKGLLGTYQLNRDLQSVLNPPSPDKPEKKYGDKLFRLGDKVMQIRNNYRIGWKRRRDLAEGQGVFNGDVGIVRAIDSENGYVSVEFDDERFVRYEAPQLEELELAYAVTVHKSQGSEFPVVVMPISWFPPMLSTRNLLYTGITRGKRLVVLCGMQRRMEAMIDNNSIKLRYSGLRARLERMPAACEREPAGGGRKAAGGDGKPASPAGGGA